MKKLISKFIANLGFIDKYELAALQEEHDTLVERHVEFIKKFQELETIVDDYQAMFMDCVELNHRVKKMEEYLKIKYVVEPSSKLFIGYKKKK